MMSRRMGGNFRLMPIVGNLLGKCSRSCRKFHFFLSAERDHQKEETFDSSICYEKNGFLQIFPNAILMDRMFPGVNQMKFNFIQESIVLPN